MPTTVLKIYGHLLASVILMADQRRRRRKELQLVFIVGQSIHQSTNKEIEVEKVSSV